MTDNRNVSDNLKRQLFTPHRDKDLRYLITFSHPSFAQPYRFVNGDPNEFADLVSNGETFQTFPFDIVLVTDSDGSPSAQLMIQNVDDRIGTVVLDLPDDALKVTLQLVLRETPDVIEYEVVGMELVDVEINAMVVSGSLIIRGQVVEPCPGRTLSGEISPVFFR